MRGRLNERELLRLKSGALTFAAFVRRKRPRNYIEAISAYYAQRAGARSPYDADDVRQIVLEAIWREVGRYQWLCPAPCTRMFDTAEAFDAHVLRRHPNQTVRAKPTLLERVQRGVGQAVGHELRRHWKWLANPRRVIGSACVPRATYHIEVGPVRWATPELSPANIDGWNAQRLANVAEIESGLEMARRVEALGHEAAGDPVQVVAAALGVPLARAGMSAAERRRAEQLKEAVKCGWLQSGRTA